MRITLARCIPLNSRSKTRQRATLLRLTWMYFCRSGGGGQLHISIYDKRDDFNFHITNFLFLSSNIPTSPAFGVFISQLIRYARACSSYGCLILGRRDFQISFSKRDTSRNALNRHWGSFIVDTGIFSNNMKFPSHKS